MINEDDIYLTAAEAMKILKLAKSTFYSYAYQGIIPGKRVGKFWRFKKSDIIDGNFGKPTTNN